MKLVARREGRPALLLGLSEENVRRLRLGDAIHSPLADLVPEWAEGAVFIFDGDVNRRTTAMAVECYCRARDLGRAVVFFVDVVALEGAKTAAAGGVVEPVWVDIQALGAPPDWHGMIGLAYAPTEHDFLERYARHIGPGTGVRIDPRTL